MLDIRYDKEADAAYIALGGEEVAESEEVAPNIIFDYDSDGRVVGIEVLTASKLLPSAVWKDARRPGGSRSTTLLALDPQERARLIAEAQAFSRKIRDDPAEQALLDEVIDIQAENALD